LKVGYCFAFDNENVGGEGPEEAGGEGEDKKLPFGILEVNLNQGNPKSRLLLSVDKTPL
jgi:hypothetical protein